MISFMLWAPLPHRKSLQHPLNMRLAGSKSHSEQGGEDKNPETRTSFGFKLESQLLSSVSLKCMYLKCSLYICVQEQLPNTPAFCIPNS